MVLLLLAHGAGLECSGGHRTALAYALCGRHLDVVCILLQHGAKAEVSVPLRPDQPNGTPHEANLLVHAEAPQRRPELRVVKRMVTAPRETYNSLDPNTCCLMK
ncbi:hypothetical protein DFH07DRAFT_782880 [Mycena maculata]|uniref:Uncharacterized protein n=1 Tax=Mycena maculata TaxID=230809 RepID=A0AAD7MQ58_9AGAR|nr:hypothetical protein DFH07DRAFT_782880 [Mycena maculata]